MTRHELNRLDHCAGSQPGYDRRVTCAAIGNGASGRSIPLLPRAGERGNPLADARFRKRHPVRERAAQGHPALRSKITAPRPIVPRNSGAFDNPCVCAGRPENRRSVLSGGFDRLPITHPITLHQTIPTVNRASMARPLRSWRAGAFIPSILAGERRHGQISDTSRALVPASCAR